MAMKVLGLEHLYRSAGDTERANAYAAKLRAAKK
jgi:hypothetical protein